MLKYQKGYICNGHTFVVNKEDVHNASDDMFVEATALLPIKTNADTIRTMSDERLAELLCLSGWAMSEYGDCLKWLHEPPIIETGE